MFKYPDSSGGIMPKSATSTDIQKISDLLTHYGIKTYDDFNCRQPLLGKALGLDPQESYSVKKTIARLRLFQIEQGIQLLSNTPKEYLCSIIFNRDNFNTNYIDSRALGKDIAKENLVIMVEAYLQKHEITNLDQLTKIHTKLSTALGLPKEERRSGKSISIALLKLCAEANNYLLPPTLPSEYSPISDRSKKLASFYFDPNILGQFAETNRELALVKYLLAYRINFISDLNKKHSALGFFLGLSVEDRRNRAKLVVALKEKFNNIAKRLELE